MNKNLPALTDGSLSDYLNEIKKFLCLLLKRYVSQGMGGS